MTNVLFFHLPVTRRPAERNCRTTRCC
jgi:hypothetical protein